jgi:hypothetical protein
MIVQVFVVILACTAASLVAITIAGVSLSVFGKLLKRTEEAGKE